MLMRKERKVRQDHVGSKCRAKMSHDWMSDRDEIQVKLTTLYTMKTGSCTCLLLQTWSLKNICTLSLYHSDNLRYPSCKIPVNVQILRVISILKSNWRQNGASTSENCPVHTSNGWDDHHQLAEECCAQPPLRPIGHAWRKTKNRWINCLLYKKKKRKLKTYFTKIYNTESIKSLNAVSAYLNSYRLLLLQASL